MDFGITMVLAPLQFGAALVFSWSTSQSMWSTIIGNSYGIGFNNLATLVLWSMITRFIRYWHLQFGAKFSLLGSSNILRFLRWMALTNSPYGLARLLVGYGSLTIWCSWFPIGSLRSIMSISRCTISFQHFSLWMPTWRLRRGHAMLVTFGSMPGIFFGPYTSTDKSWLLNWITPRVLVTSALFTIMQMAGVGNNIVNIMGLSRDKVGYILERRGKKHCLWCRLVLYATLLFW